MHFDPQLVCKFTVNNNACGTNLSTIISRREQLALFTNQQMTLIAATIPVKLVNGFIFYAPVNFFSEVNSARFPAAMYLI